MVKKKRILYPVFFMVVLTAVFTFVLAFINASSIDLIKAQEALQIQKSILYVFNIPFESQDLSIQKTFDEHVTTQTLNERTYYVYKLDQELQGYAFQFSGRGLWGTITGNIAISPEFDTILGINFISHSETPGLGGRIDESWFKEQFRNMSIKTEPPVIFKPAEGGSADAVTGATLTSNSVRDMVNQFVTDLKSIEKEVNLNE
ncbi:FMN-binding protein [Fusibacter sp. 3D3]|uniref:FMN-binding protein n=1 Tax=Fusibacter sp. 3D3 TaxID=1048380 RepID=UPI0008535618|nr:FMN-binding protein [Fusibacter sp. 3D3]GAU79378.1 Na(+)-translocating NADH-quinone reductase subunit C [Fusibacter sp. 3D3]